MFHVFENQDERRKFGGSAFLELQFCRMKAGTKIKKIVSVNKIDHWKNDSLYVYVDDIDDFFLQYENVFRCGTYSNLKEGLVDICGMTYYSSEQIDEIIDTVEKEKPKGHELLLSWLNEGKKFNGFYILGI